MVSCCSGTDGVPGLPKVGIQWGKYSVLDGMWGIQKHQERTRDDQHGKPNLHWVCANGSTQTGEWLKCAELL